MARKTKEQTGSDPGGTASGDVVQLDLTQSLPVIPLRDTVVFPGSSMPILLGREPSLRAVEEARASQGFVLLLLQKDSAVEEPVPEDVLRVGAVARVQSMIMLSNGLSKILVEAILVVDAEIEPVADGFMRGKASPRQIQTPPRREGTAVARALVEVFREYAELAGDIPRELVDGVAGLTSPPDVCFAIAPFLRCPPLERQAILECTDLRDMAGRIEALLLAFLEAGKVRHRSEHEVRLRLQQHQKEWFLSEQIRLLQEELGRPTDPPSPELVALRRRVEEKKFLPDEVLAKVREELEKLEGTHPSHPEFAIIRNYVDCVLGVPFGEYSPETFVARKIAQLLDRRHYGLGKLKQRLLEYAVGISRPEGTAPGRRGTPILCLVGPPGTGKTTLAQSIAEALERKFQRVTLGGVRDEAEIRGHRRTYIGSMPGRIITALRKAGTMNPLVLLDEIDKMAPDFRGDPAAALLEVLDPEQNHDFQDHYLEVGVDLRRVLFVATANTEDGIPAPLRDRLEVLRLPGYHVNEKVQIALKHILPDACESVGVSESQVHLDEATVEAMVRGWTREAGVRELRRSIERVCRRRKLDLNEGKTTRGRPRKFTSSDLPGILGQPPFRKSRLEAKPRPGLVTGLAWTPTGGEILQVECVLLSGRGRLSLTGTLGDVMKESAHIAITLVRERAKRYGVDPAVFRHTDIHIHFPEGAIPKDGPSAGVALVLSLLSALVRKPIPSALAFTGEVSLTGRVHAVGGLPEKTLAALEAGVATVHLPADNAHEIPDFPAEVRKGLKLQPIEHIDQVLKMLPGF